MLFIFLFAPLWSSAQDNQSSGGFFDKDFATGGFFDATPAPRVKTPMREEERQAVEIPEVSSTRPAPARTVDSRTVSSRTAPNVVPAMQSPSVGSDSAEAVKEMIRTVEQMKNAKTPPVDLKALTEQLKNQPLRTRSSEPPAFSASLPVKEKRGPANERQLLAVMNEERANLNHTESGSLQTAGTGAESLSLIVPSTQMLRSLERLMFASEKLKVPVSSVLLIGPSDDFSVEAVLDESLTPNVRSAVQDGTLKPDEAKTFLGRLQENIPTSMQIVQRLGLRADQQFSISIPAVLKQYDIDTFPVWIVNKDGVDHIFQGSYDVGEIFDEAGHFAPPKEMIDSALQNESSSSAIQYERRPGPPVTDSLRNDRFYRLYEFKPKAAKSNSRDSRAQTPEKLRQIENCSESKVVRNEVGPSSADAAFSMDVVVFNPQDSAQALASKIWQSTKVAYTAGVTLEEATKREPLMPFVSTIPIRCLPTRFHYVNDGGRQHSELREGAAAWNEIK